MDDEKMLELSNSIAGYFEAYPEDRAADGVREHIHKYWEPRMRAQLINYMDAGGEGLHPLVKTAVLKLKEELHQASA